MVEFSIAELAEDIVKIKASKVRKSIEKRNFLRNGLEIREIFRTLSQEMMDVTMEHIIEYIFLRDWETIERLQLDFETYQEFYYGSTVYSIFNERLSILYNNLRGIKINIQEDFDEEDYFAPSDYSIKLDFYNDFIRGDEFDFDYIYCHDYYDYERKMVCECVKVEIKDKDILRLLEKNYYPDNQVIELIARALGLRGIAAKYDGRGLFIYGMVDYYIIYDSDVDVEDIKELFSNIIIASKYLDVLLNE